MNRISDIICSRAFRICLFVFISGICAGFFAGAAIPAGEKAELAALLNGVISSGGSPFAAQLLSNSIGLLLIFMASWFRRGWILSNLVLLTEVFPTGLCTCLLLSAGKPVPAVFLFPALLAGLAFFSANLAATWMSLKRAGGRRS